MQCKCNSCIIWRNVCKPLVVRVAISLKPANSKISKQLFINQREFRHTGQVSNTGHSTYNLKQFLCFSYGLGLIRHHCTMEGLRNFTIFKKFQSKTDKVDEKAGGAFLPVNAVHISTKAVETTTVGGNQYHLTIRGYD